MLLTSLISAATPENPRFSLSDPAAWDALGVQPAASGVRVNRQTALTYSPYYRAMSLISGAVAKLPLNTYTRTFTKPNALDEADIGKELDKAHSAYRLLRWNPNEVMTAFVWKRLMMFHTLDCGNGYSFIRRDPANGNPLELLPLDPQTTFPVRENGRMWYVVEIEGEKRKLESVNVLHFAGLSFDGMMGYSITDCALEALGWGMGGQRYGSIFFKNSGRPSVVLMHPMKLPDTVKNTLREGWERMQTGLDNAHRTAILDGGLTLKEVSINAQQAMLIEQLAANQIDIANFFDLPPHKLGNRTATSYASLEQENQAFLDDCLDARLIAMEEQCRDKLLTEAEKDNGTVEILFDRKKLIQVNAATRAAYFRTALGGRPWMTQNEVRDEEGLNPSDDPQADEILEPLNMGKGGADNAPHDGSGDQPGGQPKGDRTFTPVTLDTKPLFMFGEKAHARAVLMDAAKRMIGRVAKHGGQLERASKTPAGWMTWLESFEAKHKEVFQSTFAPIQIDAAEWLLATLRIRYGALADTCTAKTLPAAAVALAAELEATLPAEVADIYLGEV